MGACLGASYFLCLSAAVGGQVTLSSHAENKTPVTSSLHQNTDTQRQRERFDEVWNNVD